MYRIEFFAIEFKTVFTSTEQIVIGLKKCKLRFNFIIQVETKYILEVTKY